MRTGPVRNSGLWGFTQQCRFPLVLKSKNNCLHFCLCCVMSLSYSIINKLPWTLLNGLYWFQFPCPTCWQDKMSTTKTKMFNLMPQNEQNWKHTPWRLWNGISRSLVPNGNHRVCSPLFFHPMENVASRDEILFPTEVNVPLGGHITHHSHREHRIRSNKYPFFNDVLCSLRLIGNSSAIVGFD